MAQLSSGSSLHWWNPARFLPGTHSITAAARDGECASWAERLCEGIETKWVWMMREIIQKLAGV